ELLEDGEKIIQETRRWDESKGGSYSMRSKEDAQDYKYFPDPDLPPIQLSDEYVSNIRENLPELPEVKKSRYMHDFKLSEYDTSMICSSVAFVKLFERTVEITHNPKDSANWIMGELMKMLNDTQTLPENMNFNPDSLGEIINLLNESKISRDSAKKVFAAVFADNVVPADYIKKNNMEMLSDTSAIKKVVEDVAAANQKAVDEYKDGKEKSFNFLIGQCMRALKGKAPASEVTKLLKEILG
ncbi:MAG: Asp-tRNA(Asn)/Glu-tRNA(Gln) amidotransferase GatCAB subunit B, partial [Clostridiales bacterium]|nr:Asp-tRNA(Asn)/Glu-tRNA(Gln) amidotransferase GatCAB subunit B [Clostridiales bacterium]